MRSGSLLRLLVLLGLLGLVLFFFYEEERASGPPIRIAFGGPVSGPSAEDGLSAVRAIELVFDRVNREGGVAGRPLVLDIYDDRNDGELARENAPTIVAQRETVGVIGHNYSTCSLAAGEIYAESGLPAVSTASTNPAVTANSEWYFRVIYNDRTQGRFIVRYIQEVIRPASLGIIHESEAYGRGLGEVMTEAAPEAGIVLAGVWSFDPSSPSVEVRLAAIAEEIAAPGGPAAIVLALQPQAGVTLVSHLRRLGYPGAIVGSDTLASQAFSDGFAHLPAERRQRGFHSNGLFVSTPFLFDTGGKRASNFATAYNRRYERSPDWYAAFAADAAEAMVEALRRSGIQPEAESIEGDRRRLRDALASIDASNPIEGVTGPTYFDEVGDAQKPVPIGRFRSGELVSAFAQLNLIPGIQRIEDLETSLDPARVIETGSGLLYRTDVARVGARARQFGDLNFDAGTFELDFDLWFRHRGDENVEDIVFTNAVEPIVLGDPIEEWTDGEISYRAYSVHGLFRADVQEVGYAEHVLSLNFHHRERIRDDLIYAVDSVGMSLARSAPLHVQLKRARKLLGPSSSWHPNRNLFFESEFDEHALGHPVFLDAAGSTRRFSQLTVGIGVTRPGLSWIRSIPPRTHVAIVIAAILASLFLIFWKTEERPALRLALQAVFAAIILIGAEPLLGDLHIKMTNPFDVENVGRTFEILWWLLPALLVDVGISRFIWQPAARASGHKVPSVLRYFVRFLIFLFAGFGILAFVYDYKLTGILATSGVLAMIVGLAVQLNITNIFAGVALNLERPFRVGDWIMIHGRTPNPDASVIGMVIDINWRTTRLRTADETEVVVPNGVISEKTITNFMTPGEMSRFALYFTIDQSESPDRVIPIIQAAVAEVTGAQHGGPLAEPAPKVRIDELSDDGIRYSVRYMLIPREVSIHKARHTIQERVLRRLREAGLALAYPKRQIIDASAVAPQGDTTS